MGIPIRDTIRTDHTVVFTDDQRGKIVSIALCWQNERGIRGEAHATAAKAAAHYLRQRIFLRYAM